MHVCDTWSFSAISRVVLRRSESIIASIRSSSTSTGRQSVFRLWVKNHQNQICQTNFDTAVLLRLLRHKQRITFCELAMRFFLCENKKAKYDDNVPFDFPFFNAKRKLRNRSKNFFYWIANYQITKCVLHLDYASKPKNSTEAIYEWNPQLLSCQPNISPNKTRKCERESLSSRRAGNFYPRIIIQNCDESGRGAFRKSGGEDTIGGRPMPISTDHLCMPQPTIVVPIQFPGSLHF